MCDQDVFAGIDVYNGGEGEATMTMRSEGMKDVVVMLKAGELRRVRTGWGDASTKVVFAFKDGSGLRFDNLAWAMP